MSKQTAVALLLIEAAKRSFSSPQVRSITKTVWSEVCADPAVQTFVSRNLKASTGFFKRAISSSPSPTDFQELHDELQHKVSSLSQLDEIQALFHGYAAEVLLYGEICGVVSEGIEEIVAEKLEEELAQIL